MLRCCLNWFRVQQLSLLLLSLPSLLLLSPPQLSLLLLLSPPLLLLLLLLSLPSGLFRWFLLSRFSRSRVCLVRRVLQRLCLRRCRRYRRGPLQ